MPLFRLTPIPDRLGDAAWQNSTQRAAVYVHAVDEPAARTQVSHACQAWVESRSASRVFWVSPWEDPHLVTCTQVEESSGTHDDHDVAG
jgi:hypothetical protein